MKKILFILSLLLCCSANAQERITILHTNDTHSCIEPEKNGNAGVLNRALLIEHIADSVGRENMLLFDCGDFSQGSLYYNCFKGSTEIELMNAMGYDAGTLGNHEFDFGLENLARLLQMARFDVLCANYDFTGTVCEGLVKPYTIIERGGKRIGVFGLSPDPKGLVAQENYAGVTFISPTEAANRCVAELTAKGCDAIVCLSHLGWKIKNEYNDERLAAETAGIDIILGGHSHDYFEEPLIYKNSEGKDVVMQQMGKNGRHLGWVNLSFK
ncbi:MAG: metallophosphatase [Bacteroidaceae bacterium]|nr:metallophosphatase [Bacteroidaceae bacterium]